MTPLESAALLLLLGWLLSTPSITEPDTVPWEGT